MSYDVEARTIRPAAVLPVAAAALIVAALEENDVSRGGVWNATPGLWQRYDRPWNGRAGSRGTARLVGSVAVVYDRPRRHEITVYKASLTVAGRADGWTADRLCDDALSHAGFTLATCPRADLSAPPGPDPFGDVPEPRQRSLSEILHADVRDLLGLRR